MPRGGARPNSGPKKNSIVQTTREAMLDATRIVNLTPAQVFAENMRFWYDAAVNLTTKIEAMLDELPAETFASDPELLRTLHADLKNMVYAREKAQQCAVDMAPYRHPRLGQIEVTASWKQDDPSAAPRITHQMSPKEAAARYEAMIRGEGVEA